MLPMFTVNFTRYALHWTSFQLERISGLVACNMFYCRVRSFTFRLPSSWRNWAEWKNRLPSRPQCLECLARSRNKINNKRSVNKHCCFFAALSKKETHIFPKVKPAHCTESSSNQQFPALEISVVFYGIAVVFCFWNVTIVLFI